MSYFPNISLSPLQNETAPTLSTPTTALERLRATQNWVRNAHTALAEAALAIPGDSTIAGDIAYDITPYLSAALDNVQTAYDYICDAILAEMKGQQ